MSHFYILENKIPVPVEDVSAWEQWFNNIKNRRVGETQVGDYVNVSTVFLGIDHRFADKGAPQFFETQVFGGDFHQQIWRYATWEEAEVGHKEIVALIRVGSDRTQ